MGRLRYSINVTLDGCCDHEAVSPNEALHHHAAEGLERADALLFGRVTYQMMESAWRPTPLGEWPAWMEPWMQPFARTIDAAAKHVVSASLERVDWNSQLVEGELGEAVRELKSQTSGYLLTGGVQLPRALAELGLIDDYEFIVHPRIAGRGPSVLAGWSTFVDLAFAGQKHLDSGAIVLEYRAQR